MALQNLQQYGCQTGNKLKEKSHNLNRIFFSNKNKTMFGSGYEIFGSISGCTCLISKRKPVKYKGRLLFRR
jgi:hypothetical protein